MKLIQHDNLLDENFRAFGVLRDSLGYLSSIGAVLGRSNDWILFDAKRIEGEFGKGGGLSYVSVLRECVFETHPSLEEWLSVPVFGRATGDDSFVFVELAPNILTASEVKLAPLPYLSDAVGRIKVIPQITGRQFEEFCTLKEDMEREGLPSILDRRGVIIDDCPSSSNSLS